MSDYIDDAAVSDETLIANARYGNQQSFAELWRRHARSGARVARQFTSASDADDLVSEAFARIYQRVLAGGGPTGAFRPYLYTTIRNLASSWGAAAREVMVNDIELVELEVAGDDPAAIALDHTLTVRAFRSLPERWQSVLWYTEVEGMDPHEVAPILGLSANGVAALSHRAREGLRRAWLQAHVSDTSTSQECRYTLARLGEHARHSLRARDSARVASHLAECARCSIVSEEVDEVGSRLALVLLPILLGGVAGGTWLASLSQAGSAAAQALPLAPVFPTVVHGGAVASTAAGGAIASSVAPALSLGAATASTSLLGSLLIAAVVGGTVALLPPQFHSGAASMRAEPTSSATPADAPSDAPTASPTPSPTALPVPAADTSTAAAPGTPQVATVSLDLTGKGTAGATVTVTLAGAVEATAKVSISGDWSVHLSGLPADSGSLHVSQQLTVLGVVQPLTIPLSLTSSTGSIDVLLLN